MLETDFRNFLRDERHLQERTISSRISNCKSVERHEGNLDHHFDNDRMQMLLNRLSYSAGDERQNRPPHHQVPIAGNVRNGSATLKGAVSLYQQFRLRVGNGPATTHSGRAARPSWTKTAGAWPEWHQPQDNDILRLAKVLTPLVRLLHPDIVRAVTEDNRKHSEQWSSKFIALDVDPNIYLWQGSPCAFPGVRRHAGSAEIALFRGNSAAPDTKPPHCLSLDDNTYPKHLWAFVFMGKPFSNQGPKGYELAHLADHKEYKNRWNEEFATEAPVDPPPLFGLFTSPANTAYVPSHFLKPTDFAGSLRALLLRKAHELYGNICRLAPPPLVEKAEGHSAWYPEYFEWSDPVGTMENVTAFLDFRRECMAQLIAERSKMVT